MKHLFILITLTATVLTTGCAGLKPGVELCDALKDSAFAVGSFGCMKIQEPVTRDVCQKAALAGALVARAACVAKLGAGVTPEIGDPRTPEDKAFQDDAQAIVNEWKALEQPPAVGQRGK